MKSCHPFVNNLNVISLGYGCAVKTELIRKYFPEQPAHFFDYLGNFDGLDTCTQIILNNFQDFQEMDDLTLKAHSRSIQSTLHKFYLPGSAGDNLPDLGTGQGISLRLHLPQDSSGST